MWRRVITNWRRRKWPLTRDQAGGYFEFSHSLSDIWWRGTQANSVIILWVPKFQIPFQNKDTSDHFIGENLSSKYNMFIVVDSKIDSRLQNVKCQRVCVWFEIVFQISPTWRAINSSAVPRSASSLCRIARSWLHFRFSVLNSWPRQCLAMVALVVHW